ncbi:MAG: hypothetical protein HQL43_15155 [Alphaproteobacteria bacterium]|nr:hypothetical protein [Alphaproteobacteria bacterium]
MPSPKEQADNLIRWIGSESKEAGELIQLVEPLVLSVIGCITKDGLRFVMTSLEKAGLITVVNRGQFFETPLTMLGWERFETLEQGVVSGRVAFMAMKFGNPELDRIVDDHLRPAVHATGFVLRRLDDAPRAGLIDDRLRVEIKSSRFLISDLTHGNKGAYWEAGYAEGLGKPVIYTCKKEVFEGQDHPERPHFDTNHHLTVVWDSAAPEEAVSRLKATIRATLPEAKQSDD